MEAIISISWSPSSIATSDSLNAILCSKVNLHFGRVEAALPRDAVPLGFLVGLGVGGGGGMGRSMGGHFKMGGEPAHKLGMPSSSKSISSYSWPLSSDIVVL